MLVLAAFTFAVLPPQTGESIQNVSGPSAGALLGHSLAAVNDLDDDGIPEMIVGAPGTNAAGPNSGAAFIYSSKTGHKITTFVSQSSGSRMGWAVANGGDFNRDGLPEMLVGGPGYNNNRGSVFLINGKNGVVLGQFDGFEDGDEQGAAIVTPGDINGDGSNDFLFGAPGFSSASSKNCGIVRAYSGRNRQLLFEIPGEFEGQRFGESMSLIGDLDDDGVADFMVGCPDADLVLIISSASGETIREHRGTRGGQFGASATWLGDTNGDGINDYVIGEPFAANGSGLVHIFSGRDGNSLKVLKGDSPDGHFGSSLSSLNHGLLVGAPGVPPTGKCRLYGFPSWELEYEIFGFYEGGGCGQSVLAVAAETGAHFYLASPTAAGNGKDSGNVALFEATFGSALSATKPRPIFKAPTGLVERRDHLSLDADFIADGWKSIVDKKGRWILWTATNNKLAQQTAELISEMYLIMDNAFGTEPADLAESPITLVLTGSSKKQELVCASLSKSLDAHDAQWVAAASSSPHMLHHGLKFALVRSDKSTKNIKRPDVQLAHFAVHLEFVRRFGALPAWLPEAISYGLQDALVGEVYGYSNRGWEKLTSDYHAEWREQTADLFAANTPELQSLISGINTPFEQSRAYGQFAFGLWLLQLEPGTLGKLSASIAGQVGGRVAPGVQTGLLGDQQVQLVEASLGANPMSKAAAHFKELSLEGGPRARRNTAIAAIEKFATDHQLSRYLDAEGSFRIFTEFGTAAGKRSLMTISNGIRHLENALQPLDPGKGETVPTIFILRDRQTYHQLCEATAAAVPTVAAYVRRAKESTGFTLPSLPFSAYFDDPDSQQEAVPELSGLHNITHLWLRQKYGHLPLWLSEGLACAVEENARGLVYGNWNLSGFIFSWTHSEWRKRAKGFITGSGDSVEAFEWEGLPYGAEPPKVKMPRPTLEKLYEYRATTFREEYAHLAFAVAAYGLENNPRGLKKLCTNLQKEYQKNWITVGRFEPTSEWTVKCVNKSFGRKFAELLEAFWAEQ